MASADLSLQNYGRELPPAQRRRQLEAETAVNLQQIARHEEEAIAHEERATSHKERAVELRAQNEEKEKEIRRLPTGRRPGRPRAPLPEERIRDAFRALETFTLPEVAARADCTAPALKGKLSEWLEKDILRDTGTKFMGQRIFEFVKPLDEGAAFKVEQEQRSAEVVAIDIPIEPVEGTGRTPTDGLPRPIRTVVRRAIARGWKLRPPRKGGHGVLTKDGCAPVTVPGTPSDPEGAAKMLRRNIRDASTRAVKREKVDPGHRPDYAKRQRTKKISDKRRVAGRQV